MKNNVTEDTAAAIIATKISEAGAKIARLEKELGAFTEAEAKEAEAAITDPAAMTPRQWLLLRLSNARHEAASLEVTAKAELIFPKGRFVLVPKNERLQSPAGFHPDECVFLKPSAGAVVDRLPKASNMAYYDFTAA